MRLKNVFFGMLALTTGFFWTACGEDEEVTITVKTYHVENVTSTGGRIRGQVATSQPVPFVRAGLLLTAQYKYPSITTAQVLESETSLLDFSLNLSNLSSDSLYYFRAFAQTADTVIYGTTYSFYPMDVEHDLVYVEGGSFIMGATPAQLEWANANEKPAHTVQLDDYYLGKYEITNAEFARFLNSRNLGVGATSMTSSGVSAKMAFANPKGLVFDADLSKWTYPEGYGAKPVVYVTWYGASEYCRWAGGHLPTEAQWEYAARGGALRSDAVYSGSNDVDLVGWYRGNNNSSILELPTHVGGEKAANELGLYDMSGNVWEWCQDWYADYSSVSQENPSGPTDAAAEELDLIHKVRKGGGWADTQVSNLRVSVRAGNLPSGDAGSIGFRLAKSAYEE
jgi:formylglycine-generating enzyme required for sulfatase activity